MEALLIVRFHCPFLTKLHYLKLFCAFSRTSFFFFPVLLIHFITGSSQIQHANPAGTILADPAPESSSTAGTFDMG